MKKVILCPNPYRDSGLKVAKASREILESIGFETVVCLPFHHETSGEELLRLLDVGLIVTSEIGLGRTSIICVMLHRWPAWKKPIFANVLNPLRDLASMNILLW